MGKLVNLVAEVLDFSWADKSEVKWIENQKKVLSLVAVKRDLLESVFSLAPSLALEVWCSFLNNGLHFSDFIFLGNFWIFIQKFNPCINL